MIICLQRLPNRINRCSFGQSNPTLVGRDDQKQLSVRPSATSWELVPGRAPAALWMLFAERVVLHLQATASIKCYTGFNGVLANMSTVAWDQDLVV